MKKLAQQHKLNCEFELKAKGKCEKHRVLIANQLLKRSEVISVDEDVMELQIRQIAQNMNDPGRKEVSPPESRESSESIVSSPEPENKLELEPITYIKKRLNPFALDPEEEIEGQISQSEPHLDSEPDANLYEELVIFREE